MTPYFTPRQGRSLNRKLHTNLRRRLLHASPWAVAILTALGVLLWLNSVLN